MLEQIYLFLLQYQCVGVFAIFLAFITLFNQSIKTLIKVDKLQQDMLK